MTWCLAGLMKNVSSLDRNLELSQKSSKCPGVFISRRYGRLPSPNPNLTCGDCLSFHTKGSYSGPLDGAPALLTVEWVVNETLLSNGSLLLCEIWICLHES